MTFEPYDVVVVPFPFADKLASRRRPALVVSSRNFQARIEQSILAMITSTQATWPSDVPIQGWRDAGLRVPCNVRFKLFTLDHTLILRRLGRLSERDRASVGRMLGNVLAIRR